MTFWYKQMLGIHLKYWIKSIVLSVAATAALFVTYSWLVQRLFVYPYSISLLFFCNIHTYDGQSTNTRFTNYEIQFSIEKYFTHFQHMKIKRREKKLLHVTTFDTRKTLLNSFADWTKLCGVLLRYKYVCAVCCMLCFQSVQFTISSQFCLWFDTYRCTAVTVWWLISFFFVSFFNQLQVQYGSVDDKLCVRLYCVCAW